MRRVIRLGDKTSHGGEVVSAAENYTIMGKAVARMGDMATCPIKGHGACEIVEGDPYWTINGRNVALEGHKLRCGAALISSCGELGRSYEGDGAAGLAQGFSAAAASKPTSSSAAEEINFDEQLQFLSKGGKPYSLIDYKLILADGSSVNGKTDAAGKTERIVTDQARVIARAEFFAPALSCCARHAEESANDEPAQVVDLQGVQTNPQDVGSSVVKVTAEEESRPLTTGEIAMCKLIFKDAIDYSLVKVHNHEYLLFGMQDDNTAMTPNGEIYFNKKYFKEDFSLGAGLEVNINKQWFMHEMVHVWQDQLHYPVMLRGAIRIGLSYEYTLKPGNRLSDYNMEAQGDVLADYFVLKYLRDTRAMRRRQYENDLALYEEVLRDFIANPKNASNLP